MKKLILFFLITFLAYSQFVTFNDKLDISPKEYKERRQKLIDALPDYPIVMVGNIRRNRINDTNYEFRQESNFYYLTGYNEPGAYLILSKKPFMYNGKKTHELMFVLENNKESLTWEGKRLGPKRVMKKLGIEQADAVFEEKGKNRFEAFMKKFALSFPKFHLMVPIIKAQTMGDKRSYYDKYRDDLIKILQQGQTDLSMHETPKKNKLEILDKHLLFRELAMLRSVKSSSEIEMLQRAVDITISGHHESFKIAKDVHHEFQVEAAIEYAFKFNGAEDVGYNSIVGCGENGTILHYNTNRAAINHDEVFCLDAGAEYHNYTADITRSFPSDGSFSKEQKEIYDIVLAGQSAGAKEFVPGSNYGRVEWAISKEIGTKLEHLGIITFGPQKKSLRSIKKEPRGYRLAEDINLSDGKVKAGTYLQQEGILSKLEDKGIKEVSVVNISQLREVFPHGWGHHVGLDVHDPGPVNSFKEGMIMTIEPGIYISDRISFDIDPKYLNIGIRIEDMYLITPDGNICMSEKLPRETKEIEKYMTQKSTLLLNSKVKKNHEKRKK